MRILDSPLGPGESLWGLVGRLGGGGGPHPFPAALAATLGALLHSTFCSEECASSAAAEIDGWTTLRASHPDGRLLASAAWLPLSVSVVRVEPGGLPGTFERERAGWEAPASF